MQAAQARRGRQDSGTPPWRGTHHASGLESGSGADAGGTRAPRPAGLRHTAWRGTHHASGLESCGVCGADEPGTTQAHRLR